MSTEQKEWDMTEVDSQDLDHTKPHRLVSSIWKLLQSRDGSVSLAGELKAARLFQDKGLGQKNSNSQT